MEILVPVSKLKRAFLEYIRIGKGKRSRFTERGEWGMFLMRLEKQGYKITKRVTK